MTDAIGYGVTIEKYGTEKQFMGELIDKITGLSTNITCSGSLDQYDSSDTSTVPEFTFSINGKETFKIKRLGAISTAQSYLSITGYVGLHECFAWNDLPISNGGALPSVEKLRSTRISWLISGDLILLCITSSVWKNSYYSNNMIVNIKSGEKCYGDGQSWWIQSPLPSRSQIFNIEQKQTQENPAFRFYNYDIGESGVFTSRFSFTSKPGTIDYVKSAAYINNNYKAFDVTAVYDCTTVNIGDTVSLNNGAYLAVGTNQLVKVS